MQNDVDWSVTVHTFCNLAYVLEMMFFKALQRYYPEVMLLEWKHFFMKWQRCSYETIYKKSEYKICSESRGIDEHNIVSMSWLGETFGISVSLFSHIITNALWSRECTISYIVVVTPGLEPGHLISQVKYLTTIIPPHAEVSSRPKVVGVPIQRGQRIVPEHYRLWQDLDLRSAIE